MATRKKTAAPASIVLFVRHGMTPTTGAVLPGRAKGLHLSPEGREQAEKVAERLASLRGITAVYASPLERTRETAAPIARALGLRVRVERGLTECDFGAWTGRKLTELRRLPAWRTVQHHPSGFRFPEGESFVEMQTRVVTTIQRLVTEHAGSTIVVVSHADPIKAAVAHAVGTHLDLFQRIVISPCSVTAIWYGSSGPALLSANSTGDDLGQLTRS
jgi:probable phosphoglycerate mutase